MSRSWRIFVQESCSNRAKLVRVKLAGLQAEGAMFQAAFADAVGHMVKQTSEQPTQVPHKAFVLLPRRYPKSKWRGDALQRISCCGFRKTSRAHPNAQDFHFFQHGFTVELKNLVSDAERRLQRLKWTRGYCGKHLRKSHVPLHSIACRMSRLERKHVRCVGSIRSHSKRSCNGASMRFHSTRSSGSQISESMG